MKFLAQLFAIAAGPLLAIGLTHQELATLIVGVMSVGISFGFHKIAARRY